MKIIFKNICLHNFLSFEDATLKLNDCGYILIQGQNNNPIDLASSNGSGKSALLEAISWCLTGETIRGSKEVTRLNVDDFGIFGGDTNSIMNTTSELQSSGNKNVYTLDGRRVKGKPNAKGVYIHHGKKIVLR